MVGASIGLKLPAGSAIQSVSILKSESSPWSRMSEQDEEQDQSTASCAGRAASDARASEADIGNAASPSVGSKCTVVLLVEEKAFSQSEISVMSPSAGAGDKAATPIVIRVSEAGEDRESRKVFRRLSSRMSHHTMNTMVTEAVSDALHGLEPLSMYMVRLMKFHRCLVLASIMMVALGVAGGMAIEKWSFLTALYVIVQIITTIGYGDITVDKEWMKLFMAVYVLLSLVFVANFLNILLSTIIERHSDYLHKRLLFVEVAATDRLDDVNHARRRLGHFNEVIVSGFLFFLSILAGTLFFKLAEDCSCSHGVTALADCRDDTFELCAASGGHIHTWITAFYMSVITVTTVGFGDYSPKTVPGRIFGLFWMTTGVAATGFFIASVSKVVAKEYSTEISGVEAIDEDLFQEMDADGNGHLSKDEYLRFVLLKHGFIAKDVLRDIDEKYSCMQLPGRRTRKGATFDQIKQVQAGTPDQR